jgi:hypothetical protein
MKFRFRNAGYGKYGFFKQDMKFRFWKPGAIIQISASGA